MNYKQLKMQRNRKIYFLLIVLTITIGLVSRTEFISSFITEHFGDYLYAILFFLIFGFIFTKVQTYRMFLLTLLFCYGIEFFQLYQPKTANWISFIRSYEVSRLILGNNFQWNDIISYTVGVMTGYISETLLYPRFHSKNHK
ncbi:DUF2809 domain-containing protein [Bernardetia sp. ABR2-2B]|uniref:ribosomal maturation YjgA family protein n=1 Tax=Bernardetia sp. ABR2-2B TaxID=3127472 RepID=UPI0030D5CD2A